MPEFTYSIIFKIRIVRGGITWFCEKLICGQTTRATQNSNTVLESSGDLWSDNVCINFIINLKSIYFSSLREVTCKTRSKNFNKSWKAQFLLDWKVIIFVGKVLSRAFRIGITIDDRCRIGREIDIFPSNFGEPWSISWVKKCRTDFHCQITPS